MQSEYESLLGYEEGARKIHVHLTRLDTRGEPKRYEHSHKAEEAMYFLQGEAEYAFRGKTHRVGPGDLLFFRPGEPHGQVKFLSDTMEYLVIRSVEEGEDEACCCGKDRPCGEGAP